jgi:hypothetical protein
VAVISLAAGALASANATDKLDTLMSGAALLVLAAFAPFALLKLIPMVEAGALGHLERLERRPIAAATRAATMVAGQLIGAAEGVGAPAAAGGAGETATAQRVGGELNHVRAPGEPGGGPPPPGPGTYHDSSPPDGPPPPPAPTPGPSSQGGPAAGQPDRAEVTAGAGTRSTSARTAHGE